MSENEKLEKAVIQIFERFNWCDDIEEELRSLGFKVFFGDSDEKIYFTPERDMKRKRKMGNRCASCGKETGMFMISQWFWGLIKRVHCVECVNKKLQRSVKKKRS